MKQDKKDKDRKSQIQVASFKIGKESYGIGIEHIREIIKIPLDGIYSIPNVPDYIIGIYNLRGQIIPLINLHNRFNILPISTTEEDKLLNGYLVIKIKNKLLGFFIDKVLKVVNFDLSRIQEPPATLQTLDREYISGVIKLNDDEVLESDYLVLIDVEKIFSKDEIDKIPLR